MKKSAQIDTERSALPPAGGNVNLRIARVLNERAEISKAASVQLHEPRPSEDALRMARLAAAVDGAQKVDDPLPLAVLLRGSGYGYLR